MRSESTRILASVGWDSHRAFSSATLRDEQQRRLGVVREAGG